MPALLDKKTVLLVEDDPIYAEFISSSVAKAGLPIRFFHVKGLNEALAYLGGDPPYADRASHPLPDVVLLDITLGLSTGFPVLQWLRDHGQLQNEQTRVVILTNSERTAHVQEALQLGALSYVVKSPSAATVMGLLTEFVVPPSAPGNQQPRPFQP